MNLKELSHAKRLEALEREISAHTNFLVMLQAYLHTLEASLLEAKVVDAAFLDSIRKRVLTGEPSKPNPDDNTKVEL